MKREVEPIANAREPTRRAVSLQVKLLLAICLLPSLSMLTLFGDPKPWGDENYYLGYVAALCDSPWHSLLPGRLLFDWWPLFYQQLTAQFASCQGLPDGLREATATYREALTALPGPHPTLLVAVSGFELVPGGQWKADLFARLSLMNYGLFLLSGGLVYRLARLLGCREWVGAVACGTYWINPRIFFYLGTLWPEVLHGFLLLVFMVSLGTALQEDRLALPHRLLLAVLAGLAGAAALFTKGVMGPYLWLLMAGGLCLATRSPAHCHR